MNGAFLYDLIRTGHLSHPIAYAREYYGHLPALSMPYHPPVFPLIEALLFAIFGVKLLTARAAVAISVGLCGWLLYRLTLANLGSHCLAACVTTTTFSLAIVQFVARDVMLELPTMVFTLAALYCLRDFHVQYRGGRAVLFALLAVIAVWTKQHAVFLGAVPFIWLVLAKSWRRLAEPALWVGSILFAAGVLGLIALSRLFNGAGVNQMSTSGSDFYYILTRSLPAYFQWIARALAGLPGIFGASAVLIYWFARRQGQQAHGRNLTLYFAWIIAVVALLLDLGPVTPRYLFFVFPALVTVGYAWLFDGCRWLWGRRTATLLAGAFAGAWFLFGLFVPVDFLRGPKAAAETIVRGSPARILYAGQADGNFIFAVRELDPKLQVVVVSVTKLSRANFEPGALQAFCRKYGIEWVVFEDLPGQPYWSGVRDDLRTWAKLDRTIPLESTPASRWHQGTIQIYRLPPAPASPGGVLQLPVPNLGGYISVKL